MKQLCDAYLDIETTGLSSLFNYITVIGIYLVNENNDSLIQLVGEEVTRGNLMTALAGVDTIYTYNGSRFDFPFIRAFLDVDLNQVYPHHDLMYDCWRNNLKGGLKAVEQQLGIPRQLTDIGGLEAVILWWRYQNDYDRNALQTLLSYNREDVTNLKVLKERLQTIQQCGHDYYV